MVPDWRSCLLQGVVPCHWYGNVLPGVKSHTPHAEICSGFGVKISKAALDSSGTTTRAGGSRPVGKSEMMRGNLVLEARCVRKEHIGPTIANSSTLAVVRH
jgi:hypothetical protein